MHGFGSERPRVLKFARCASVDGQGMDIATRSSFKLRLQSIINEPMPGHAAQAREALADDAHAEVTALLGTGVTGVQVAVVLNFQN